MARPREPAASPAPPPLYMYFLALCAALNSLGTGYDIGSSTGIGMLIQDDLRLVSLEVDLFLGSAPFMAAIGSLLGQGVGDTYGRRRTFAVAQSLSLTGRLLVIFAKSVPVLLIGRLVNGIGMGVVFGQDSVYIAEAAPAEHRGKLTTFGEISLQLGVLIGYACNWALAGLDPGINWRVMTAVGSTVPIAVILLAAFVLPESPRWLVREGFDMEAAAVLRKTHPAGTEVDSMVRKIRAELETDLTSHKHGWGAILRLEDPHLTKMLLIGVAVALCQQLSCYEAVGTFTPEILRTSQVAKTEEHLFGWTMLLGIVKLFGVVMAACFLDKFGRRPMLLAGTFALAVSEGILAVGILNRTPSWLAVVGVLSIGVVFSLSLGPCAWLLPAELFPSQLRAKGMSLAVMSNRLTCAFVILSFPPLSVFLGGPSLYFALAAVGTVMIGLLFWRIVPETKGLSLEDLHRPVEDQPSVELSPSRGALARSLELRRDG